jgi:glycosyltransferase
VISQGLRYRLSHGSCADYDFMLQLFIDHEISPAYINKVMVTMRDGGLSNGSLKKVYRSFLNDYGILKRHNIPLPFLVCVLKRLRKLDQFFLSKPKKAAVDQQNIGTFASSKRSK